MHDLLILDFYISWLFCFGARRKRFEEKRLSAENEHHRNVCKAAIKRKRQLRQ
ncbi:hypothetical protein LPE509_00344 [Legionella pneumophila subsp. pneumophila LPE509]|nr:hypothetical protein LPE509_00344 [Legionella pneumophila subsp. pneumophila LPE509]